MYKGGCLQTPSTMLLLQSLNEAGRGPASAGYQEVGGLLAGAITSSMVALAFARQRLQQTATDLGTELASEVVLVIEEVDCVASTRLGPCLVPWSQLI